MQASVLGPQSVDGVHGRSLMHGSCTISAGCNNSPHLCYAYDAGDKDQINKPDIASSSALPHAISAVNHITADTMGHFFFHYNDSLRQNARSQTELMQNGKLKQTYCLDQSFKQKFSFRPNLIPAVWSQSTQR